MILNFISYLASSCVMLNSLTEVSPCLLDEVSASVDWLLPLKKPGSLGKDYYYVPTTLFVMAPVSFPPKLLAMPKSDIFGFISVSSKTLLERLLLRYPECDAQGKKVAIGFQSYDLTRIANIRVADMNSDQNSRYKKTQSLTTKEKKTVTGVHGAPVDMAPTKKFLKHNSSHAFRVTPRLYQAKRVSGNLMPGYFKNFTSFWQFNDVFLTQPFDQFPLAHSVGSFGSNLSGHLQIGVLPLLQKPYD
ncbi:hypothetical protein H5410_005724 [Solanum commersonii]|uniref:Uncharacterized protein n=1 Tax=Solanum commersonii TaxID=4109 RepID=A0A9J6A868_SOLCO|nr:hypothetical protein H5410_005724 [Solanum commersonii]